MSIRVAVPDADMLVRMEPRIGDDVELIVWRPTDPPFEGELDLLVIPYVVSYELLAGLPHGIKHIQSQSLGYDGAAKFVPKGTTFSNAVGVHEAPAAEIAITLILASQRGWPEVGRNQSAERWEQKSWPGLIGRRVLLIGVGGIGHEFEKRVAGFDVHLTRVARRARYDIHSIGDLNALLPGADIVVLALPLVDETRGLVDDAFLDRLPHGALIVNVSRGAIVDTDALVRHVRSGAVRSALDVVDPEPLPPGHPLWSLPGSLLTPHLGGNVQSMLDRIDPLVIAQINRLRAGQAPDHIVIN
ncbi:MAG TPA: 2-hydroxyacid dehydrogenase [Galbitalea sp.]